MYGLPWLMGTGRVGVRHTHLFCLANNEARSWAQLYPATSIAQALPMSTSTAPKGCDEAGVRNPLIRGQAPIT